MKNKTKVVVALASLLAVTGGIGAYSTFAWFSTTNTATVNVNHLTIYNRGNFKMSFAPNSRTAVASDGSTITTDDYKNSGLTLPSAVDTGTGSTYSVSGTTANALDISGNGVNFYRPIWQSGYAGAKVVTSGDKYETIKNQIFYKTTDGTRARTGQDFCYITFDITFTNSGSNSLGLVLDKGSAVTSDFADAVASTRVAFLNGSDDSGVSGLPTGEKNGALDLVKGIWQYSESATKDTTNYGTVGYPYIKEEASGVAYSADTSATGMTLASVDATTYIAAGDPADKYATKAAAVANHRLLAYIPASGSYTLRLAIWIEGTLSTADDDIIGKTVITSFVFTGLAA